MKKKEFIAEHQIYKMGKITHHHQHILGMLLEQLIR